MWGCVARQTHSSSDTIGISAKSSHIWLRKYPSHCKTFVANRVSYIQTELQSATWSHVPTKGNPSDLATRGAKPADLAQESL